MSYGRHPYGGVAYAASDVADIPDADTETALAVEVSFTTDALAEPVWVGITADVRSWDVSRGRNRELERFQPGRATVVLGNLARQYDSVNAAGPHFGNIRPGRRIRIRETFNGVTYPVFDGFVDRWQLDYPGTGHDATATVTATDAFKLFARTDLPLSVHDDAVRDDTPQVYLRLDETKSSADDSGLVALNSGSLGSTADATYVGPPELGGERLIVNDPGSSMKTNKIDTGVPDNGAKILGSVFDLHGGGTGSFVVEGTLLPQFAGLASIYLATTGPTDNGMFLYHVGLSVWFQVKTGGSGGTVYSVSQAGHNPLERLHIVARYKNGDPLRLWVNGVLTSGDTPAGAITAALDLQVGYQPGATPVGWTASVGPVAIWRGAAAEAVDQTFVDRHHAAGTHPWQGDLPGARAGRVLDEAEWPASLRELDTGAATFQSAALGTTALEHLQKVGETEFALLFMTRDGKVRLISRATQDVRAPGPAVFGDVAGEVGYTAFVPDDGDDVIRNRATISRLNGVAKVSVGGTIDEFGRFDYVLEGLLNNTDAYSQDYADFVVAEYQDPRRRITSLSLGPPITGDEDIVYPEMLGRELGDAVTVKSRPIGGGALFSQVCVVEGIRHTGSPGGVRATSWSLSPEFTEALF